MPRFSNFSLWFMGRTMASTSCKEEKKKGSGMLLVTVNGNLSCKKNHKWNVLLHLSCVICSCCNSDLLDLLVQASDVTVLLRGPLVHLHGLHPGVVLRRQGLQDQIRVLVDSLEEHAHIQHRMKGKELDSRIWST